MDASDVMAVYAAAWVVGHPERAWSFYADDVVLHLPGRGSLGPSRGSGQRARTNHVKP